MAYYLHSHIALSFIKLLLGQQKRILGFIMKIRFLTALAAVSLLLTSGAQAAPADFHTFNIRNNDGSTSAPWDADLMITENGDGDGFSAATPRSGQKVGYGTNAYDGLQLNQLATVTWDKVSGKDGVVPYLNIWVTDGVNYAIISSENDYRGTDFSTRQDWKVFEYDPGVDLDWLFDSGDGARDGQYLTLDAVKVTLADLSDDIKIFAGQPFGSPGIGSGAPQGGYGFNIIMGDTQSNYVGNYEIDNLQVTFRQAVPEPAPLAVLGFGLLSLAMARKRRG